MDEQNSARRRFRRLHERGCFVMPNAWSVGSAIAIEQAGFEAVASSSAGFAFECGQPDAVGALRLGAVLEHLGALTRGTTLPINADLQNGYATDADGVATNVLACAKSGVAGLSIEDASGDASRPLYGDDEALERVRAARAALDSLEDPPLLTARCEAWLVGVDQPFVTARRRLVAFAEAGADCLFAPDVEEPQQIRELVQAVAPRPLNVLVSSADPRLTVRALEDLGVRRVSVGSALARSAWGAALRALEQIRDEGRFEEFESAAPFARLNGMFTKRAEG